jgi:hypothetical protein
MQYFYLYIFLLLSFIIIVSYWTTINSPIVEPFNSNKQTFVLLGDSILKNDAYVADGKSVDSLLIERTNGKTISLAIDHSKIVDVFGQIDNIPDDINNNFTTVFLSAGGNDILSYYKKAKSNTGYVFPILLHDNLTPIQVENRKAKKLKRFNSDLKKIAEIVGINKTLTSYVARHSYATNLKQIGVSTDLISQSMGHQNIAITSAYLKDFDDDVIDDANEKLLMEPLSIYYSNYETLYSA